MREGRRINCPQYFLRFPLATVSDLLPQAERAPYFQLPSIRRKRCASHSSSVGCWTNLKWSFQLCRKSVSYVQNPVHLLELTQMKRRVCSWLGQKTKINTSERYNFQKCRSVITTTKNGKHFAKYQLPSDEYVSLNALKVSECRAARKMLFNCL